MILDRMFSLVEALNIVGLLQCGFLLAIIVLKAADVRQALAVVAFFTALGVGFGLPAPDAPQLAAWAAAGSWLVEAFIPPLSYILILQIAIGRMPSRLHTAVLALPLLGLPAALALTASSGGCGAVDSCPEFATFLGVVGVGPGAVALLLLWLQRGIFTQLRGQQDSSDRYWVALTLVAFNVLNLGVDLARAGAMIGPGDAAFVHTVFGLTLIYLVTTLAFRIDPKPVVLLSGVPLLTRSIKLTREEQALAKRVNDLMERDKLYQEPAFSRADLARELDVSENVVSRVINSAFDKNFRQLLNEHRVTEAKALLANTDLEIAYIAFDVGFNSLATFKRAFKDITGLPPTEFRAEAADEARADGNGPNGPAASPATPNPSGIRG